MSQRTQNEQNVNRIDASNDDPEYNNKADMVEPVKCESTVGIAMMVSTCVLIAATIVWIVYAIIALSNSSPSEFQSTCSDSNLWTSLLVSVISICLTILDHVRGSINENGDKKTNVVLVVLQMGSVIFSSIDVFRGCAVKHLSDTLAYKLQFWNVVITYGIWGLIL